MLVTTLQIQINSSSTFMMNCFLYPSRYGTPQYFCYVPLFLLNKEMPGCAFQRLQLHKRRRQSWMKASLFAVDSDIQRLPFPQPSTPPMMTYVLIIGSRHIWCSRRHQKSHVEMQKFSKTQRKEKANWLPGLVMLGRRSNHLTLPSLLSLFEALWDMSRTLRLISTLQGHPLGIKQLQKWRQGTVEECRSPASTVHYFMILIDCQALSNVT